MPRKMIRNRFVVDGDVVGEGIFRRKAALEEEEKKPTRGILLYL